MAKKEKKAEEKFSSVADLTAAVNKRFGTGTLMIGRGSMVNVEVFPTNIATLDLALGCGGVPRGRVFELFGTESSGKTTTCLQIIAACQKHIFRTNGVEHNGVAAFIDAEHAYDPAWAAAIGVDNEALLFSQPSSGDEALMVAEMLVKSGQVQLVIIDSVAALIPKSVLDGEVTDNTIGQQAQLMSKSCGRLAGAASKTKTSIIFINQIREKVGVMFGCLHGDTKVNFVDGRSIPIATVVNEKINGAVWGYNESSRKFEPCQITDWHYNGDVDTHSDYIAITAKGPGNKNGRMSVTVTPDHLVMTDDGWHEAKMIAVGDRLMTKYESIFSDQSPGSAQVNGQRFLYGVLSGDSHISQMNGRLNGSLRIRDNTDIEYAKWKVSKLADLKFVERKHGNHILFESEYLTDFALHKEHYPNRDPMALLNNFSWLGMSIWIMDDAVYNRNRYQLSIKRFRGDHDKIEQISRALDNLGLYHYASAGGAITFDKVVSDRIASEISTMVPPCMDRKLPEALRGKYVDYELSLPRITVPTYAIVTDIREASDRQMKRRGKFDISVADNCCYIAGGEHNGLLVHNSPETTPGGRALKFYSSIRMDIRKGQPVKGEDDVVLGFQPTVKIIKNKVAPPFRTADYTLCVGTPELPIKGVDLAGALMDVAEDAGIVLKAGSSYSFTDPDTNKKIVLGAGSANAAAKLREEPSLFDRIQRVTYDKLFGTLKKIEPVEVRPVTIDDSDGDDEYNPILDEEEPTEGN